MTHFPSEHSGQIEQTKVAEVANKIASYLRRTNGNTAETLDGILEWWIPRQRILEERYLVEQAIKQLCEKGVLFMRKNADGSVIYSTDSRVQPRTVDE